MKVYLLAAGYATRMFPLTRDCAKPLLDVAGAPILTHILDRVLALEDVSEVVVVTNARFVASFRAWAAALDVRVTLRILDDGSACDDDKLGAIGDLLDRPAQIVCPQMGCSTGAAGRVARQTEDEDSVLGDGLGDDLRGKRIEGRESAEVLLFDLS